MTLDLADDAHLNGAPNIHRHVLAVLGLLIDFKAHAPVALSELLDGDLIWAKLNETRVYELLGSIVLLAVFVCNFQLVKVFVTFADILDVLGHSFDLFWLVFKRQDIVDGHIDCLNRHYVVECVIVTVAAKFNIDRRLVELSTRELSCKPVSIILLRLKVDDTGGLDLHLATFRSPVNTGLPVCLTFEVVGHSQDYLDGIHIRVSRRNFELIVAKVACVYILA